MLALPIPILTFVLSAVACILVWRMDIGHPLAPRFFTAVFALIATGALLTGLRFGYGLEQFVVAQRAMPLFVGPLIYLGFKSLTRSARQMRRNAAAHLVAACAAALLPQTLPQLRNGYDLVIGASYLFYFVALVMLWRRGADGLVYAPLGLSHTIRKWLLASALMLAVLLVFDSGIAMSFAMQRPDYALDLISIGSLVLMIGAVFAIVLLAQEWKGRTAGLPIAEMSEGSSVELERSVRALLKESRLYLDTDLTLERLAKRLHVPARAVSRAINQTQQMNVSRYVNGFRVRHAADLLASSDMSVTEIMEHSGFLTRSNFYREFERIHSQSPAEYRRRKRRDTDG